MTTAFTDLVGCRLPLQLAPMGGGVGSPELAAAVTAAGGLGMLSSAFPLPVADQLAAFRARTEGPVGVGFFAFELPARRDDLEVAAQQGQVVDLFWGEPDPQVVSWVHDAGALAFWQVGTRDEAVAARDAGCDVVVAQGVEAGGHVRGTTPLLVLLEQVVGAVDVPVVAAGGIATAARLQEVLTAGASAARVGTRFLATTESAAHPSYLAALLAAGPDDTELTTAYGDGWPDAPHRVLGSSVEAARSLPEDAVVTTAYGELRWPVSRWSPQPPSVWCSGPVEAMPMYAGQGVGDVTSVPSVRDVVAMLLPSA